MSYIISQEMCIMAIFAFEEWLNHLPDEEWMGEQKKPNTIKECIDYFRNIPPVQGVTKEGPILGIPDDFIGWIDRDLGEYVDHLPDDWNSGEHEFIPVFLGPGYSAPVQSGGVVPRQDIEDLIDNEEKISVDTEREQFYQEHTFD